MNFEQLQREFAPQVFLGVTLAIERAVKASFAKHPLANGMTETEVKRRIVWCCDMAVMLRRQLLWSSERICDTMPGALDTYLTMGEWNPPQGRVW